MAEAKPIFIALPLVSLSFFSISWYCQHSVTTLKMYSLLGNHKLRNDICFFNHTLHTTTGHDEVLTVLDNQSSHLQNLDHFSN